MTTPYGLFNAENRGILFIGANVEVNEGMIAGERRRDGDLEVNFCKLKRLTNMRFSVSDVAVCLTTTPPDEFQPGPRHRIHLQSKRDNTGTIVHSTNRLNRFVKLLTSRNGERIIMPIGHLRCSCQSHRMSDSFN